MWIFISTFFQIDFVVSSENDCSVILLTKCTAAVTCEAAEG